MIPCFFYPECLGKRGRWNKFDEHLFLTRCFNHLDSRLCLCFLQLESPCTEGRQRIAAHWLRQSLGGDDLEPEIDGPWWKQAAVCTLYSIFLLDFWKCYIKTLCLSVYLCQCLSPNSIFKSLTSSKIIKHNNCTRVYIHHSGWKIWSSSSRLIRWVKLGDAEKPPDLKVRWLGFYHSSLIE